MKTKLSRCDKEREKGDKERKSNEVDDNFRHKAKNVFESRFVLQLIGSKYEKMRSKIALLKNNKNIYLKDVYTILFSEEFSQKQRRLEKDRQQKKMSS